LSSSIFLVVCVSSSNLRVVVSLSNGWLTFGPGCVEVRFVDGGGLSVTTSLGSVDGRVVVRGRPVRSFPTYPGQRNYPGWLWTATTGGLVGYESLLVWSGIDCGWLTSIPQNGWLSGRDGASIRRHVPGFLLDTAKGLVVVDVKPAALLVEHVVAAVLDWCGRLCAGKGWTYEVWSGDDPVRLRNVRVLAAGSGLGGRSRTTAKVEDRTEAIKRAKVADAVREDRLGTGIFAGGVRVALRGAGRQS
jgi:hypothetical protein